MILGKYAQSKTVYFDLFQVSGVNFEPVATFAAGDVRIMIDEGAEANTTNLPTDEGQGYSLVLTNTEMTGSRIKIYIVDQTGTKVWLDTSIYLETYGNASAEHAFDLDTASTPQTADHTSAIADIPTVSEFNARTLIAADYFDSATDTVILPTIPANWITAAGIATNALDGKGNWNIGKTGYTLTQTFPANFAATVISGSGAVDSLVQGYLNSTINETTAGRIAGNFDVFFENADLLTSNTVDDVGGGSGGTSDWTASERSEIRGRLGITGATAAGGNTPTLSLQSSIPSASDITTQVWAASSRTLTAFSFTVDCDVQRINGATVIGNGSSGNLWRA